MMTSYRRAERGAPALAKALAIVSLLATSSAYAATTLFDDFEDGDTIGWGRTANGTGSTGVEFHQGVQGSLHAFVKHEGAGSHALSRSEEYGPNRLLAFEMHPQAIPHPSPYLAAGADATISFLDANNGLLGQELNIANVDGPGSFDWVDVRVGATPLAYSRTMLDWANEAGVPIVDDIVSVNLVFWSYGAGSGSNSSRANLWFDNVTMGFSSDPPVQVPLAAFPLFVLLGPLLLSQSARHRAR